MYNSIRIKKCPPELTSGKVLFCDAEGHFYREIKLSTHQPGSRAYHGARYPSVTPYYGNALCHVLVCSVFQGLRPKGYECDHLNGNIFDWRASNLQWVTPEENQRRAHRLRALRKWGMDTNRLIREVALRIYAMSDDEFAQFLNDFIETNINKNNVAGDVYAGE